MFLLERLVGVSIYCCVLVIVYLLIAASNRMKCKTILGLYVVALSVMAYFYEPYTTADLYRIFLTMDLFAPLDFAYFFETYAITSSAPIGRTIFWLFAKMGDYHLISVASTMISYSLIFYILLKAQAKYSISRANLALSLLFLMSTSIYISVIAGIRMMIAMSLIVFCFFRESVEHRFKLFHILFYMVAVFIHNMAIIILGVRMLAAFFSPKTRTTTRLAIVLLVLICGAVFVLFFDYMVKDVFDTILHYLFEPSYSDPWEYIIGILIALLYFVLVRRFHLQSCGKTYRELATYNRAAKISMLISVAFCFVFSIFYRFIGHLIPILIMPMMMIVLREEQKQRARRYAKMSFQRIVLIYSGIILFLNCARGSLSCLKFFVLS